MFRIPRLSTLCLIATVCLSSWLALGRPAPQPQPANAAIAPTRVQPTTKPLSRVKPIAEAQLGERTIGQNPLREQVDDDLSEPNQESWRKLTLRLPKDNGKLLTVELLRSLDWIETEDALEGGTIFLDLAEMGAVGDAEVVSIEPCPPIQPGKGNVITGRFIHEVEQGEVIELRFAGQSEATRVTKNHPYWSVDRTDFVPSGELLEGETVEALVGTTTITSVIPSDYSGLVFNLEVHGEHVYRVGSVGALAHNSCFGSAQFGQRVHNGFGAWFQQRHGVVPRFDRTRPGLTGVDLTFRQSIRGLRDQAGNVQAAFRHAELKPASWSGWNTFQNQLSNWRANGMRGNVGLFMYDAMGNIFFVGTF